MAGVVLVDGSHPDQWAEFGFSSRVVALGTRMASVLARFGVFRIFGREYALLCEGLPKRAKAELMAFASTPRALATASSAARAWDTRSRLLLAEAGGLGDLPLVVLSVTEQPRRAEELTRLQARLAALSTNSEHLTVEGASHEGLISQPAHAELVARTIVELTRTVAQRSSSG